MKNKKSIPHSTNQTQLAKFETTNSNSQNNSTDNMPQSGKSELEKRKERTHNGSTKPDKNHIG